MLNRDGWRVGCRYGVALLAGVCGASCEGETRDYVPPNVNGAAGSSAAGLPTMPAMPGDNAVGVTAGDPSGGELITDINRLQPADESGASGAESQTNAACVDGSVESCGPPREEGICKFGTRMCAGGQWGECMGAVFAKERDCSSTADNDCDGQPDNTQDEVCRCPMGGAQACDEHAGLDGKGACKAGKQSCVLAPGNASSDWGPCEGSVGPANADSCNVTGDDSNCDGAPNGGCTCVEGTTIPCGPETDNGICQRGTSTCRNGAFSACEGAVFAGRRDCSSPQDNDCDGLPDNTVDGVCSCVIGTTQPCGAHPDRDGNGPCRAGTQTCEGSGQNAASRFGVCSGAVGPAQRDLCTSLGDDSDCNGTRNGGCQCIAGGGNAPCSGDANNSRCSAQGTCAPCQVNTDCSLVSGGRSVCNAGRCVAPRCGDGITNAGEACDDGNSIDTDGCSNTCQVGLNLPVVTVERFAWTSRQGPVDMGPAQGRACFLTRVGGSFDSNTDPASVAVQQQNGRWVLTGRASAGGFVEARAACANAMGLTNEVSWQAGMDPIDLQSATTHACFLTGAGGAFQGGAEAVSLSKSTGTWRLGGNSGQASLSGAARCILMPGTSDAVVTQFNTPSPLALDSSRTGACYLTFLCGDFGAEGDFVQTEWNGAGWEFDRQVGGTRSLRGAAVCFGRNDGTGVPAL